jgi:poly(A) polymerase
LDKICIKLIIRLWYQKIGVFVCYLNAPIAHCYTHYKKLQGAGYIAYFAGGWVRDFLMQHPSDDIDIATSASVEEVAKLFPKTIPVGIAFGIIIVVENSHQFEVATFRTDGPTLDGRRPQGINPATPEEDAKRRDFTINGLFYDPLKEKIYDYVGGKADIEKGIIKAIGDPHERFLEDRLRMMRAVRYSTRFNFPIDPATTAAILAHATSLFPSVAIERIFLEFKKMSLFSHFDQGLVTLHQLNLLPTIFPDLAGISSEEVEKRVSPIKHFPKNTPTIAELLELFPNQSSDKLIKLCEYLKISNPDKQLVQYLHHAQTLLRMPKDWQENLELVEWAHFYANPHASLALDIMTAHLSSSEKPSFLQEHAERRSLLEKAIKRIQSHHPLVSAELLMQEGIPPGKHLGLLLKEAERLAVNHQLEDPKEIIALLKQSSFWKPDR